LNIDEQAQWKQEALLHAFAAIACRPALTKYLVFKGAQVLRERLPDSKRVSLDLDATQRWELREDIGDDAALSSFLKSEFSQAMRQYFASQEIVRFELEGLTVKKKPRHKHPRGWDAFEVKIRLRDALRTGVSGLPALVVDIAAPEPLLASSVEPLTIDGQAVDAYSLSRIAGEKLRAILQSLPAHRAKVDRRPGAVRVKDVYDVALIHAHHRLDDVAFWKLVALEFHVTCRARAVDCQGIETFEQALDSMRTSYSLDRTLPGDIDFDDAWAVLVRIIEFFEQQGLLPLECPDV